MIDPKVISMIRLLTECYPFQQKNGFMVHPLTMFTVDWERKPDGSIGEPFALNTMNIGAWANRKIDAFAKLDSLANVFLLEYIRQPFQLDYLYHLAGLLSPEDYAECLGLAWQATEWPHQTPIPRLISMWDRVEPRYLCRVMDEHEYPEWLEMRDGKPLRVYRGVRRTKNCKPRGLSWTLYESKAQWFATRFQGHGEAEVYSAIIEGKWIWAYFDRENETVLNPRHLKNVIRIEEKR